MTITVQDALRSNLPLNFMPVQGNPSKTKERRKRFPDISSQSLSVLSGNSQTLQYDRFTLSPTSPSHRSDQSSPELVTNPLRRSLLERYLVEDTHPVIRTSSGKYTLTLAGTGLSDALITPSPDNLFVRIETEKPKIIENLSQPPPRSASPKAKWAMPAGSHERARSGTRLTTIENMSARKQSGRISIHTQKRMKLTMLMDEKQTRSGPRFTRDDSGLMTPPPSRFEKSFADQMPAIALSIKPSPYDPPPAPSHSNFPGYFPASPKTSGPAPIDTSLKIFRKKDRESFMNSPVLPEDRARAVQRAIYPPPAPTSGCFPEEFPQSPARSGPAPIDTAITSPIAAPPPAPTSGQFPLSATRRVSVSNKNVKFDAPFSPSLGQLKSSASPLTPLALFCTFPAIEGVASPVLAGASSGIADGVEEEPQSIKDDAELTTAIERGRSSARDSLQSRHRARTLSAPRTTSESLLPDKQVEVLPSTRYDPTIVYDAQTNTRTVVYPIPLLCSTKSSYNVANITDSDRNRILRSYFRRGRSSAAQS